MLEKQLRWSSEWVIIASLETNVVGGLLCLLLERKSSCPCNWCMVSGDVKGDLRLRNIRNIKGLLGEFGCRRAGSACAVCLKGAKFTGLWEAAMGWERAILASSSFQRLGRDKEQWQAAGESLQYSDCLGFENVYGDRVTCHKILQSGISSAPFSNGLFLF